MTAPAQTPRIRTEYPRRVVVQEVLSSRYGDGNRPQSWDERRAGIETIKTTDGEKLSLLSEGGQSSPASGWELLVMRPASPADFSRLGSEQVSESEAAPVSTLWTLYGIAKKS